MIKIPIIHEINKRFKLQEEYLGNDKPINKTEPLVSVYTATYQHGSYIRECIESILMQKTDFPFELIIGEDDSTDGTREICIEYAEKHPDKIRLFLRDRSLSQLKDEDGNLIKILNGFSGFGRLHCRGKYIALCEGDDYWTDPLKLQNQVEFLEENQDCTMCYQNSLMIYFQKKKDPIIIGPSKLYCQKVYKFNTEKFMKIDAGLGGGLGIRTASMLFRRSIVTNLPEWVLSMPFGDMPLKLLCAHNGKIAYLPGEPTSVYRRGVPGAWSSNEGKNKEWYEKRKDDFFQILDSFNEYSKYQFNSIINSRKDKIQLSYILNVYPFYHRWEWFQMLMKNPQVLRYSSYKGLLSIFMKILMGNKIYSFLVKKYKKIKVI